MRRCGRKDFLMNAETTMKPKNHRPKEKPPKKRLDMTEGPVVGKVARFAVPLILTGILNLLYNAADLIVVGRFTGSDALAAVGATGSLNNLLINIFIGISTGAGVVAAQCFGAKEDDEVNKVLHTSVITAVCGGFLLMAIGLLFAKPLLTLMGTPSSILDQSALYMNIIFLGVPGNLTYNYCASVLRSSGDTKRPLLFLAISGAVNVTLNLILVIVFHLGVAGVAIATIISQYLSAVMILFYLSRQSGALRFSLKHLKFNGGKFRQILAVGIPCGIQGSLFSISNVLIQSSINGLDELLVGGSGIVVAGNSAGANIEGFVYTSMNALYQACVTFTGQNVGARKPERILRVLGACLFVLFVVYAVVGGVVMIFREQLLSLYVDSAEQNAAEVIAYGVRRIAIVCSTYFLCGSMDVIVGSLRGMGKTLTPAIVSLLGACGLRIVWIYTVFRYWHTLESLYISYPVSWLVTATVQFILCVVVQKQMKKRVEQERLSATS